jgi:adenosine deaminase
MRRRVGAEPTRFRDAANFFREHDLSNPSRLSIAVNELLLFVDELHDEQRSQGVSYVELRFSPRRFAEQGGELRALLKLVSDAVLGYTDPVLRLIILINRDSPDSYIGVFEDMISERLPEGFVGLDLAGDERRYFDVARFAACFSRARNAGLGITAHAGEFGGPEHIWRALDELGVDRIGHGVAAGGQFSLAARLVRDKVLVETSLTSNIGLGAVADLTVHPLPWFLEMGVETCLNCDVPLHLGTTFADELTLARGLLGNDPEIFSLLDQSAFRHRFLRPKVD